MTKQIPKSAWLSQLGRSGDSVKLVGIALDNQTISSFMAKLEESPFFDEVDLVESKQSSKDDVKLHDFSLAARVTPVEEREKELKELQLKEDQGTKSEDEIAKDKETASRLEEELDAMGCLLYTSPSPRDATLSRMPSSA